MGSRVDLPKLFSSSANRACTFGRCKQSLVLLSLSPAAGLIRSPSIAPDLISHPKGAPADEVRNNDGTNPPTSKSKNQNHQWLLLCRRRNVRADSTTVAAGQAWLRRFVLDSLKDA
jgi:hypothetical protein